MWSEERRIGEYVWWPIKDRRFRESRRHPVHCGSIASLGLLTLATRNELVPEAVGWQLKKADLRQLPVLDPRQLSSAQLQALSDLFDGLADTEFERLPGMADCPARTALDAGISEVLGLPDLGRLRVLLASEPVVCNRGL